MALIVNCWMFQKSIDWGGKKKSVWRKGFILFIKNILNKITEKWL